LILTAGAVSDMPASYTWYRNNIAILSGSANTYAVTESGTYAVSAVNGNGCSSPVSIPLAFTVYANPDIPVITPDNLASICVGSSADLTAIVTSTPAPSSYVWYLDGVEVARGASNRYLVTEGGSYTVVAVAATGCTSIAPSLSRPIDIVYPPAVPILSDQGTVVVSRQSDRDIAVINAEPDAFYVWIHNHQRLAGAVGPLMRIQNANAAGHQGLYRVRAYRPASDNAECAVESAEIYLLIDATIEIPNTLTPGSDGHNERFFIKHLDLYTSSELFIVNRWGNEVYRRKDYHSLDADSTSLFTGEGLPDGTYFYSLHLTDDGGTSRYTGYITLKRER
jgi:gliding motility-associated-like protein